MKSYFWKKKASGLKADIERHRRQEANIRSTLEELSKIENPSKLDNDRWINYNILLEELLRYKIEVVQQIGRKL